MSAWSRFRRIIDWRFLVMLAVLLLVSTVCWGFVQRVQQADSLIDTAEHSVQQVRDLRQQLKVQQELLAEQRATATERSKRARAERDTLQRQLALILNYLREQGITVPDDLTANPSATPTPGSTGHAHEAASRPRRDTEARPKPASKLASKLASKPASKPRTMTTPETSLLDVLPPAARDLLPTQIKTSKALKGLRAGKR